MTTMGEYEEQGRELIYRQAEKLKFRRFFPTRDEPRLSSDAEIGPMALSDVSYAGICEICTQFCVSIAPSKWVHSTE